MVFLQVQAKYAEYYQQPEPPFGQLVDDQFGNARNDIAAGTRCLALEEWTASVYHIMRAIESGLHYFATLVNVTVPMDIEYMDWWPIIQQMQVEIGKLQQQPRTPGRIDLGEFYSQVAANFQHFKDGWRNPTAHPRRDHDERSASTVWSHAKEFMTALAEHAAKHP